MTLAQSASTAPVDLGSIVDVPIHRTAGARRRKRERTICRRASARRCQLAPVTPADDRLHLVVRGTPLLLHLFFVYYAAPAFGITLDAFVAAIIAMSASAAAYNAEIIRAGLQAVHRGQVEAAYAVGMRYGQVVRRIIVPQAVRIIIPPYMGNAISHTKNSSLASVITVPELMLTAQMIYSSTYRAIEILTVTGAIYLVLTSCLSALQMYCERLTAYEQRGLGEGRRRRLRLDAPLPTQPA